MRYDELTPRECAALAPWLAMIAAHNAIFHNDGGPAGKRGRHASASGYSTSLPIAHRARTRARVVPLDKRDA